MISNVAVLYGSLFFSVKACRGRLRDEAQLPAPTPQDSADAGYRMQYDDDDELNQSALGPFPVFQNFLFAFATYRGMCSM